MGNSLKARFKIAEKGRFVRDSSDGNFDAAYRKAWEHANPSMFPRTPKVSLTPERRKSISDPTPSSALRCTSRSIGWRRRCFTTNYLGGGEPVRVIRCSRSLEGGRDRVLHRPRAEGRGTAQFQRRVYRNQKRKAENLITALGSNGFDPRRSASNFKGRAPWLEIGRKLGYAKKQFDESNGRGLREVLKRMGKAMCIPSRAMGPGEVRERGAGFFGPSWSTRGRPSSRRRGIDQTECAMHPNRQQTGLSPRQAWSDGRTRVGTKCDCA